MNDEIMNDEVIVAMFPFYGEYIKATVYQGHLRIYSCSQSIFGTAEEIWRMEFVK